jgi:hypothetical protein
MLTRPVNHWGMLRGTSRLHSYGPCLRYIGSVLTMLYECMPAKCSNFGASSRGSMRNAIWSRRGGRAGRLAVTTALGGLLRSSNLRNLKAEQTAKVLYRGRTWCVAEQKSGLTSACAIAYLGPGAPQPRIVDVCACIADMQDIDYMAPRMHLGWCCDGRTDD